MKHRIVLDATTVSEYDILGGCWRTMSSGAVITHSCSGDGGRCLAAFFTSNGFMSFDFPCGSGATITVDLNSQTERYVIEWTS